jgi:hypothetical protein
MAKSRSWSTCKSVRRQGQFEAAELQFAELKAEEFPIPPRVQRQLIVGDYIGALLASLSVELDLFGLPD